MIWCFITDNATYRVEPRKLFYFWKIVFQRWANGRHCGCTFKSKFSILPSVVLDTINIIGLAMKGIIAPLVFYILQNQHACSHAQRKANDIEQCK